MRLICREPDSVIAKIVEGWPRAFDARRALGLGFRADTSFDEIIRVHIEDELAGHLTVLQWWATRDDLAARSDR